METKKSSRHSKITGDLGEHLALYWLSKHGFECARVDHTGIDLIARHSGQRKVMGISVKSRSRTAGTENTSVLIEKAQFEKAQRACDDFCCTPYFALFVDGKDRFLLLLVPMSRLKQALGSNVTVNWKMDAASVDAYRYDPEITCIELGYTTPAWGQLDIIKAAVNQGGEDAVGPA